MTFIATSGAQIVLCACGLPRYPGVIVNRRQKYKGQESRNPERVSIDIPFAAYRHTHAGGASWWGPKVFAWLVLVGISFFIPNGFFMFWGNYVSLFGATAFILIGLVLLVDFAHSWSETCLDKWLE